MPARSGSSPGAAAGAIVFISRRCWRLTPLSCCFSWRAVSLSRLLTEIGIGPFVAGRAPRNGRCGDRGYGRRLASPSVARMRGCGGLVFGVTADNSCCSRPNSNSLRPSTMRQGSRPQAAEAYLAARQMPS